MRRIFLFLLLPWLTGCGASIPHPGEVVAVKYDSLWDNLADRDAWKVAFDRYCERESPATGPLYQKYLELDRSQAVQAGSRVQVLELDVTRKVMRVKVIEDAGVDYDKVLADMSPDSIARTMEERSALARKLVELRRPDRLEGKVGWIGFPR